MTFQDKFSKEFDERWPASHFLCGGDSEALKSFFLSHHKAFKEEMVGRMKGNLMSEIDLAMFRAKSNNWDVNEREKYAREIEEKLLALLSEE